MMKPRTVSTRRVCQLYMIYGASEALLLRGLAFRRLHLERIPDAEEDGEADHGRNSEHQIGDKNLPPRKVREDVHGSERREYERHCNRDCSDQKELGVRDFEVHDETPFSKVLDTVPWSLFYVNKSHCLLSDLPVGSAV